MLATVSGRVMVMVAPAGQAPGSPAAVGAGVTVKFRLSIDFSTKGTGVAAAPIVTVTAFIKAAGSTGLLKLMVPVASRATVVLGGAHASAAGGCGALTDPLKATVEKVRAPSLNFMSSVKAVLPSLARTCVPSSVTLTVLAACRAGRAGRAETSRLGPSARKSPNSGKKNVPGDPVEEYSAFDGIVAAPDMIVAA